MGESSEGPRRKPGRPKRGATVRKYTIMLEPDLHEWAMGQAEGFSALVRRLLQEEQARVTPRAHTSPRPQR